MVELMSREYLAERRMREELGSPARAVVEHRFTRAQAVAETSVDALPQAEGGHRESEILIVQLLDAHPNAPFTLFEIGELLGKPVNCLTQPLVDLRKRGSVILAGRKVNPTGASAQSWITPRRAIELARQDKTL